MSSWICRTCANHYPDADVAPQACPICLDDRQYLPPEGQHWVRPADVVDGHTFTITSPEPGVHRIDIQPGFGIGQLAALISTERGNLLWEPSGWLSQELIEAVRELGGVAAVAASHPHLVGASVAWSRAFDHAPIWANGDDRRWITHPDPATKLWADGAEVLPGLRLVQTGGHFAGSAVAHWSGAADGLGVLFSGDSIAPGPDGMVSFLRSYPNKIPLPERSVRRIAAAVADISFDRVYGAFEADVGRDAHRVVQASAERYIGWLTDTIRDPDERR